MSLSIGVFVRTNLTSTVPDDPKVKSTTKGAAPKRVDPYEVKITCSEPAKDPKETDEPLEVLPSIAKYGAWGGIGVGLASLVCVAVPGLNFLFAPLFATALILGLISLLAGIINAMSSPPQSEPVVTAQAEPGQCEEKISRGTTPTRIDPLPSPKGKDGGIMTEYRRWSEEDIARRIRSALLNHPESAAPPSAAIQQAVAKQRPVGPLANDGISFSYAIVGDTVFVRGNFVHTLEHGAWHQFSRTELGL